MTKDGKLYDRDFYAWTREQAALLRAGKIAEIDVENVLEEKSLAASPQGSRVRDGPSVFDLP